MFSLRLNPVYVFSVCMLLHIVCLFVCVHARVCAYDGQLYNTISLSLSLLVKKYIIGGINDKLLARRWNTV